MTTIDRECLSGRNVYDPRIRELVCATGNPDLFPELKIPKSTLRGWLNGEFRTALGSESVTQTEIELYAENARLRKRVRVLQAVMYRVRGWRRPRTRIHPAKPTVGICASQPNEIWHLDVTVFRLLNGTKLYLHGVVDNFSRRLLA